jgi:hypothetical protein
MAHTAETCDKISKTMKGRKPAGFFLLKNCPVCDLQMNAPNLGRHQPACEAKAKSGLYPDKTVKQVKTMRRRLRPYGMTPEDYSVLWSKQGGICNICGGENNGRTLAVDHDHKTGEVRGLLCDDCNRMLGCSHDKISVLERAVQYLKKFDPFKD